MILKEVKMLGNHLRTEVKEKEIKKGLCQKGGRVLRLMKQSQERKKKH